MRPGTLRWLFAVSLAACASAPAVAFDPLAPILAMRADFGEMHAGHTKVEVGVSGVYFDDGTIDPGILIDFDFPGPCPGEPRCVSASYSRTFHDIDPLVDALRDAKAHLAAGTAYARSLAPPREPCAATSDLKGEVTVKPKGDKVYVALGSSPPAAFDADEVDYFLGMLVPARDMVRRLQPQIAAFNAAAPAKHATVMPAVATPCAGKRARP